MKQEKLHFDWKILDLSWPLPYKSFMFCSLKKTKNFTSLCLCGTYQFALWFLNRICCVKSFIQFCRFVYLRLFSTLYGRWNWREIKMKEKSIYLEAIFSFKIYDAWYINFESQQSTRRYYSKEILTRCFVGIRSQFPSQPIGRKGQNIWARLAVNAVQARLQSRHSLQFLIHLH